MTDQSQAIEVEVVEIDGAAPIQKFERHEQASSKQAQPWKNWQGRFFGKLDRRWWPLWIFLGVILLVLLLTVGVVLGVIVLIFKILRGMIRTIIG
jgi:hypothetical protein